MNDLVIRNGFISRDSSTILGSISATTISATTYQNLPITPTISGGTYSSTGGTLTLNNTTGGTINVSGFTDDLQIVLYAQVFS